MDKKEVIKRFFEEGLLVSPSILEKIDEKNIENVIKKAKQRKIKNIENLDFLGKPETLEQPKVQKNEIEINIRNITQKCKIIQESSILFF